MHPRRWAISLFLIGLLACTAGPTAAAARTVRTACGAANVSGTDPRLRIVGNQMVDARGNVVVPYGISLVGGPENNYWAETERAAAAQIIASHRFWHANAVRIQVSEALLIDRPSRGHHYNVDLAASVNRLVCRVIRQGQIPVINDTTLFTAKSRGPTWRSVRFWRFISQRYGNLPVIFDLFDEPRLGRNPITNKFVRAGWVWHLWERGGSLGGKRYLGMQKLVDTIRVSQHAYNVIWVEEPWYLDPDKLPTSELPRHLLHGQDLVYAFHKVSLDERSPSFKALASVAAQGIPLVDSEWSQFAATGRPWECQDGARSGVPSFLSFLGRSGIGLMAWSLQPGALVKGRAGVDTVHDGNDFRFTTNPNDLATPNVMRASYHCNAASRGQGAGALVQGFFARNDAPAPSTLFPRFR